MKWTIETGATDKGQSLSISPRYMKMSLEKFSQIVGVEEKLEEITENMEGNL